MIGFFRDLFGIWGKEEKELAEKLGIRDPHPFSADFYSADLFMVVPDNIGQDHKYPSRYLVAKDAGLFKLPDEVVLYKQTPKVVPPGHKVVSVHFSLDYIYDVSQRLTRLGCCRRYTLRRAIWWAQTCGGDPVCGGGIKHLFAPRKLERQAALELKRLIGSGVINGFTLLHNYDGYYADGRYSGSEYNDVHLYLFAGNEISVMRNVFKMLCEGHYSYQFSDEAYNQFKKWEANSSSYNLDRWTAKAKISRVNVRILE